MNRMSDQFFTCSAFSRDKNSGASGGHLTDDVKDVMHGFGLANEGFETEAFVHLLAELNILLLGLAALDGSSNFKSELIDIHGFGNEIVGAAFHRVDCVSNRAVGGHQHTDRRPWSLQDSFNQCQPIFFTAQSQIGQH
jgi:hypothetical protein